MRLATWNCQTGLRPNWDLIQNLDVDVLTVQECEPSTSADSFVTDHQKREGSPEVGSHGTLRVTPPSTGLLSFVALAILDVAHSARCRSSLLRRLTYTPVAHRDRVIDDVRERLVACRSA
jgi:hypothetical protein